jgi:hypothetical protein
MKKTIKNNILNKIQKGEVKMRSGLSVFAGKLGMESSIFILFLGLIFLSGLLSLWIKTNSDLVFGEYGRYGLRSFFQSFPYLFVLIFIVFFMLLRFLLKKFDISYKKPFIIILSVILGLAILFGIYSINTSYGKRLYQSSGRYFRIGQMMRGSNFFFGKVVKLENNRMIVLSEDNKEITVTISKDTHFPFGKPVIGDEVRCVGEWDGNNFKADGIRVFDSDDYSEFGRRNGIGGMRDGKGPKWIR